MQHQQLQTKTISDTVITESFYLSIAGTVWQVLFLLFLPIELFPTYYAEKW